MTFGIFHPPPIMYTRLVTITRLVLVCIVIAPKLAKATNSSSNMLQVFLSVLVLLKTFCVLTCGMLEGCWLSSLMNFSHVYLIEIYLNFFSSDLYYTAAQWKRCISRLNINKVHDFTSLLIVHMAMFGVYGCTAHILHDIIHYFTSSMSFNLSAFPLLSCVCFVHVSCSV